MPSWGSWFLSGFSRPVSTGISSRSSDPDQAKTRVLHGRVTKPTQTTVTPKFTEYKSSSQGGKTSERYWEEDVNSGTISGVTVQKEPSDWIGKKEQDSESEVNENEDYDVNQLDDRAESPTSPLSDTMAQVVDSEDTDAHDTESESDTETAWRWEQVYLNTILNARNKYTLMPSTWRMHFRGIPLPDSLFYIKTKSKSIRPKIYARTDRLEYRGALALRRLIDVHARIQDIRSNEAAIKVNKEVSKAEKRNRMESMSAEMAKQLTRALEQALIWARQDGGIDTYGDQVPPNVKIMELKGMAATDRPESGARIQTEICGLAEEWRSHASSADTSVQAPIVFGFVIMKHIITIVTLDSSDPGAIFHVPCQLHMAERNQHQWNALAILVTVCWARDLLLEYIDVRPDLQPEVKIESSDPDA